MRPNRSSPMLVALFRERWPGGGLPREMIASELKRRGTTLSLRMMDYALAEAVRQGELAKITSYDDGALYFLGSYARANSGLVERLEREPWRSLNSKDKTLAARALRRWQGRMAQAGAHDLRPNHKCIACGYKPHRDP